MIEKKGQREGVREGTWETPWDHLHLQRDPETGDYAEMEFCERGEKCKRGEDPTESELLDLDREVPGGWGEKQEEGE